MTKTEEKPLSVRWLGHAAFSIADDRDLVLIDPWLTDNPQFPGMPEDAPLRLLLVTHGHFDHLGDSISLSRQHGVPLVAPAETGIYTREQGAEGPLLNVGGTHIEGDIHVHCVPALHSSSVGPERRYGGLAAGYVLKWHGKSIYHAGDTALFGDMRLIGETYDLDLALLPIGGTSTMDPFDAIRAIQMLKPRNVVPMHFNTWDFLRQDAQEFQKAVVGETDSSCLLPSPGERIQI